MTQEEEMDLRRRVAADLRKSADKLDEEALSIGGTDAINEPDAPSWLKLKVTLCEGALCAARDFLKDQAAAIAGEKTLG